jgi:hypothetical protein
VEGILGLVLLLGEEVAVVGCAFLGAAEGGVGFADFDELVLCVGVVGVEVWVVGFGEGVELSAALVRSVLRDGFCDSV